MQLANHLIVLSDERRLQLLEPGFEALLSNVVIGSKLVLATRTMMTCLYVSLRLARSFRLPSHRLWCLKMAVFDLLARLISNMPYERFVVYGFWSVLLSTFVASVITVFVDCHPFELYWQIYPNPGEWYGAASPRLQAHH